MLFPDIQGAQLWLPPPKPMAKKVMIWVDKKMTFLSPLKRKRELQKPVLGSSWRGRTWGNHEVFAFARLIHLKRFEIDLEEKPGWMEGSVCCGFWEFTWVILKNHRVMASHKNLLIYEVMMQFSKMSYPVIMLAITCYTYIEWSPCTP